MKKILTLFAMLLVTASTLLAQTADIQEPAPKLSYQIVVRSNQATEKFKVNDLVFNDTLQGTFMVNAGNGSTSAEFTAVTNLNGMLSLTVVDKNFPGPATGYGMVKLDKSFEGITWKGASVTITIPAYGVNETMDIYPVPYAFYALFGNPLSTDIIVDYINQHNGNDVDAIYKAIVGDDPEVQTSVNHAIDSLIADAIRNNTDAVKQLLLHFLGQLEKEDLDKFYDGLTANQAVDQKLADTLADIMGRHYSTARDIVLAYIPKVTTQDVQEMCHVVNQSVNSVTIYTTVLDSLCNYMKDHKDQLERAFKKAVGSSILNENNIQYALDYLQGQVYGRTTNTGVYGAMTTILDSIIDAYLTENGYLTNAACSTYTVCDLVATIETLENSGFRQCPELGGITLEKVENTNNTYKISAQFTNNVENVNLNVTPNSDSLVFVLSYPYTINKNNPNKIQASFEPNGNYMVATVDFDQYVNKGQIIDIEAIALLRCKTILKQKKENVEISTPLCPTSLTVSNTHAVDGTSLYNNNGVKLSATINYNYPNKVTAKGFLISSSDLSDVDIINYDPTVVDNVSVSEIDDNNTFTTKLNMKYCTKEVYYKAYVVCDNQYIYSDFVGHIDSVRGPSIEIEQVITPDDSVKLTAQGYFTIASMGGKKTLEAWIEQYGNEASAFFDGNIYYTWNIPGENEPRGDANNSVKSTKVVKTIGEVTGNVNVPMFGSTCTVSKTVTVVQQ